MTDPPKEPVAPKGMVPHKVRVRRIAEILQVGNTAAVVIDNEQQYIDWYLYEIAKYPALEIISHGPLSGQLRGTYCIKVRKRHTTQTGEPNGSQAQPTTEEGRENR